jgi:hypothetical protein
VTAAWFAVFAVAFFAAFPLMMLHVAVEAWWRSR